MTPTVSALERPSVRSEAKPLLMVGPGSFQAGQEAVGVYALGPDLMSAVRAHLHAGHAVQSLLRVAVVQVNSLSVSDAPHVSGRYEILEDAIKFMPHLPFDRGVSYQAIFDLGPLNPECSDAVTFDFSLPNGQPAPRTKVEHVYPSSDELPANLLRLYIRFSNPMQDGVAVAEITVIGPDGETAPDILYRAPVELWDRSMHCLTILLDPGRLKRGVGPNRALGPPLKVGESYTLVVGAGMVDLWGRRLANDFQKRFRVTEDVREPVAIDRWWIETPLINTHQPLRLEFPRPLDWALLSNSIKVATKDGLAIDGHVVVDEGEKRWSFEPTTSWVEGSYEVSICASLEDVCGNDVMSEFDRSVRPDGVRLQEPARYAIPFSLASTACHDSPSHGECCCPTA